MPFDVPVEFLNYSIFHGCDYIFKVGYKSTIIFMDMKKYCKSLIFLKFKNNFKNIKILFDLLSEIE